MKNKTSKFKLGDMVVTVPDYDGYKDGNTPIIEPSPILRVGAGELPYRVLGDGRFDCWYSAESLMLAEPQPQTPFKAGDILTDGKRFIKVHAVLDHIIFTGAQWDTVRHAEGSTSVNISTLLELEIQGWHPVTPPEPLKKGSVHEVEINGKKCKVKVLEEVK